MTNSPMDMIQSTETGAMNMNHMNNEQTSHMNMMTMNQMNNEQMENMNMMNMQQGMLGMDMGGMMVSKIYLISSTI